MVLTVDSQEPRLVARARARSRTSEQTAQGVSGDVMKSHEKTLIDVMYNDNDERGVSVMDRREERR